MRNFTQSSMSAWCRIDCYERQHHIASFQMDQPAVIVDGTQPVSDKHRIAFAALPSKSGDSKVTKVKSCIGKVLHFNFLFVLPVHRFIRKRFRSIHVIYQMRAALD